MININLTYDWWMLGQILLSFILFKTCKSFLISINSINTLVLLPIAPTLALVLYALTRVKNKNYYDGVIPAICLIGVVLILKSYSSSIIVFSMALTIIVYSLNRRQDGFGPVLIGLFIGWLCRDVDNPISFIISANMISDYCVKRFIGSNTNKFKLRKEGFDNKGGMLTVLGGLLEAAFIGAPSDVISNNKDMMDGMSDILCITNMLFNGSMRGSSTVVVTNGISACIFFSILILIYLFNENIEYIKEEDKIWPPIYTSDIMEIPNWQLMILVATLCVSYTLPTWDLIIKFVIIVGLSMFVRIKVTTSLFFSSKLLFS